MTLEGTLIPDDMRTEEIISDIVDQLEYPRIANGKQIEYSIFIVNKNYSLKYGQTLRDAELNMAKYFA